MNRKTFASAMSHALLALVAMPLLSTPMAAATASRVVTTAEVQVHCLIDLDTRKILACRSMSLIPVSYTHLTLPTTVIV